MQYTDGTMKFKIINNKSGGVLPGVILAFSGTFDSNGYPIDKTTGNADTTWHLCDGTNDTPDLRGRFILGVSGSHPKGTTGGEETHTLAESELPKVTVNSTGTTSTDGKHKHNITAHTDANAGSGGSITYTRKAYYDYTAQTSEAGGHAHTVTTSGTFGGGRAHNNMPPFYTLSYIMKL